MKHFSASHIILMLMMLLSAGMASALRPTISLADELPPISLRTIVPSSFGDWQELPATSAAIVDPTQKELLDKIYSETLTRTYAHRSTGYRIMLSIAYGKNQSDALQLHKPEVCYPAQGFAVRDQFATSITLSDVPVRVTRLLTTLGQRSEPLTYWVVVGDQISTGALNKKMIEIRYALRGRIPDGMLVRVSSIDTDNERAFSNQTQFAQAMVASISPSMRSRVAGDLGLQ